MDQRRQKQEQYKLKLAAHVFCFIFLTTFLWFVPGFQPGYSSDSSIAARQRSGTKWVGFEKIESTSDPKGWYQKGLYQPKEYAYADGCVIENLDTLANRNVGSQITNLVFLQKYGRDYNPAEVGLEALIGKGECKDLGIALTVGVSILIPAYIGCNAAMKILGKAKADEAKKIKEMQEASTDLQKNARSITQKLKDKVKSMGDDMKKKVEALEDQVKKTQEAMKKFGKSSSWDRAKMMLEAGHMAFNVGISVAQWGSKLMGSALIVVGVLSIFWPSVQKALDPIADTMEILNQIWSILFDIQLVYDFIKNATMLAGAAWNPWLAALASTTCLVGAADLIASKIATMVIYMDLSKAATKAYNQHTFCGTGWQVYDQNGVLGMYDGSYNKDLATCMGSDDGEIINANAKDGEARTARDAACLRVTDGERLRCVPEDNDYDVNELYYADKYKCYREYRYHGIEYKSPDSSCVDPRYNSETISAIQRYYFRGNSLPPMYNCDQYLPSNARNIAEVEAWQRAYECCKLNEAKVCLESTSCAEAPIDNYNYGQCRRFNRPKANDRQYVFCEKGTCTSASGTSYDVNEVDAKFLCFYSKNLCPFNHNLNGGTNEPIVEGDAGAGQSEMNDMKDTIDTIITGGKSVDTKITLVNLEPNTTPASAVSGQGKMLNFCQYRRHCAIKANAADNDEYDFYKAALGDAKFLSPACLNPKLSESRNTEAAPYYRVPVPAQFVEDIVTHEIQTVKPQVYVMLNDIYARATTQVGMIVGKFTPAKSSEQYYSYAVPIYQCMFESVHNLAVGRVGSNICANGVKQVANNLCGKDRVEDYMYKEGDRLPGGGLIEQIRITFKSLIIALFVLAVILFGYKLLLSFGSIDISSVMMFALKLCVAGGFVFSPLEAKFNLQEDFMSLAANFSLDMLSLNPIYTENYVRLTDREKDKDGKDIKGKIHSGEEVREMYRQSKEYIRFEHNFKSVVTRFLKAAGKPYDYNLDDAKAQTEANKILVDAMMIMGVNPDAEKYIEVTFAKDGCRFFPWEYPANKSYLAIWDMFDCKINKFTQIEVYEGVNVSTYMILLIGIIFFMLFYCISLPLVGGVPLVMVMAIGFLCFVHVILLVMIMARCLHLFISTAVVMALYLIISPFAFVAMLFDRFQNSFDNWLSAMISLILFQGFVIFFIIFFLDAVDMFYEGESGYYVGEARGTRHIVNSEMNKLFQFLTVVATTLFSGGILGATAKFGAFAAAGSVLTIATFSAFTNGIGDIFLIAAKQTFMMYIMFSILDRVPKLVSSLLGGVYIIEGGKISLMGSMATIKEGVSKAGNIGTRALSTAGNLASGSTLDFIRGINSMDNSADEESKAETTESKNSATLSSGNGEGNDDNNGKNDGQGGENGKGGKGGEGGEGGEGGKIDARPLDES